MFTNLVVVGVLAAGLGLILLWTAATRQHPRDYWFGLAVAFLLLADAALTLELFVRGPLALFTVSSPAYLILAIIW